MCRDADLIESGALTNLGADYYCLVLPILEEPRYSRACMLPLTSVDGASSDVPPKINDPKSCTMSTC